MLSDKIASSLVNYYDWWTTQSTEKMYGFVFFSTSLLEYAGCTIFTEEGLEKVARSYREMEFYQDSSIEQLKEDLRWSPCDSPNHMTNEEIFSEVDDVFEGLSSKFYEMEDSIFLNEVEKIYESVVQGVIKFRHERLPLERDDILVTMLWGDISPEEISRFIRACNSEKAAQRFIREMSLESTGA